jgi:hypothetical protein
MRKYAAATALAIALSITMLTLTVSASLTPANARSPPECPGSADTVTAWGHMFGVSLSLAQEKYCSCQCWWDAMRRSHMEPPTSNYKKSQACAAKCVNEFEARPR